MTDELCFESQYRLAWWYHSLIVNIFHVGLFQYSNLFCCFNLQSNRRLDTWVDRWRIGDTTAGQISDWRPYAAFTPGYMLPDTSFIHLLPSTYFLYRRQNCRQSVRCWIQRYTSRPWHKWIVIMSPRYSQHVSRTSNIRRHVSGCKLLVRDKCFRATCVLV